MNLNMNSDLSRTRRQIGMTVIELTLTLALTVAGVVSANSPYFSEVAAAGAFSCGLRTDQTIFCWGRVEFSTPTGTFDQIIGGREHY